jgi:hypothetical protein
MEGLRKNETFEKLKQELELRGKYYFKGFGNYVQGLGADLDYLTQYERTPEIEKHTREMINKIVSSYQSISFEQITNHPDYDLLKEISEAILKLVPEVEAVLDGKNSAEESWRLIKLITEKGREYQARLIILMKQINEQPGHEDDGFPVVDLDGKTWKYPF